MYTPQKQLQLQQKVNHGTTKSDETKMPLVRPRVLCRGIEAVKN